MAKQMGYRETVAWIALNDEPTCIDPETVAGFISTALAADIFGKSAITVATAVVTFRLYYNAGASATTPRS